MLTIALWILGMVLGLIGLFVLICIPHNLRVRRVRRVYRSLPTEVVEQVLHLIEQAAANGLSITFLRLSDEVSCDDGVLVQPNVSGLPYAESSDDWPQGTPEGEPAKFMLQVRLDHPGLVGQWQGPVEVTKVCPSHNIDGMTSTECLVSTWMASHNSASDWLVSR